MSTKYLFPVYCLLSTSLAVAVRNDFVTELYSHGHEYSEDWGAWGDWDFCPPHHYAYHVSVKWVPDLGPELDDTSTNGIRLVCGEPGSSLENGYHITSSVGSWGDWEPFSNCGYWLTGFQVAVQPWQGYGGDDTAVNSVRFFCGSYNNVEVITTRWGIWEDRLRCPQDSVICGVRTQVEDEHPSDVAGLIRVAVACCVHP